MKQSKQAKNGVCQSTQRGRNDGIFHSIEGHRYHHLHDHVAAKDGDKVPKNAKKDPKPSAPVAEGKHPHNYEVHHGMHHGSDNVHHFTHMSQQQGPPRHHPTVRGPMQIVPDPVGRPAQPLLFQVLMRAFSFIFGTVFVYIVKV